MPAKIPPKTPPAQISKLTHFWSPQLKPTFAAAAMLPLNDWCEESLLNIAGKNLIKKILNQTRFPAML